MYYSSKDMLRASVIPVLLGASPQAFCLAWKIYLRSGIISYICDERQSAAHALNPCSKFFPLISASDPRVMIDVLTYLAAEPDHLPIIIPCNDFYSKFADQNRELLEERFIISDHKRFFDEAPMSVF